jgi:hypothetical protein
VSYITWITVKKNNKLDYKKKHMKFFAITHGFRIPALLLCVKAYHSHCSLELDIGGWGARIIETTVLQLYEVLVGRYCSKEEFCT